MKPFPERITVGDKYGPAMTITDQAEADEYFEACVEHTMNFCSEIWQADDPRAEAERIERLNLGYIAGYYDHETRVRVERLFSAKHPIFGTASKPVDPEKAFELGKRWATANQN